jgi:putative heme-binding domain-containing protein
MRPLQICNLIFAICNLQSVLLSAPPTLPNTAPLTTIDDLASVMVSQADAFLLNQLAHAPQNREQYWHRDLSSPEAYNKSIAPNRADLAHMLGVRDPRVVFDSPELVSTLTQPALVGRGETYDIFAIRWPVLPNVHGEGLLLQPRGKALADVIAIPDCSQTPEQLAGLAPGMAPESQFARRLAESGCRVIIPTLINRDCEVRPFISNREFIYRSAFELGRHIIGYEVQKVLAAVDFYSRHPSNPRNPRIGVIGYGEGGLLALDASALDPRISAAVISGYFDNRQDLWREPIDRNVFGLLREFGNAEIASMIAPRTLIIDPARFPELTINTKNAAPGRLLTPGRAVVESELDRARKRAGPLASDFALESGDKALAGFLRALGGNLAPSGKPPEVLVQTEAKARHARQFKELDDYNQSLLAASADVRKGFMARLDTSTPEKYAASSKAYREIFYRDVIGRFDLPLLPPSPRTRLFLATDKFTAYEVLLDVFDSLPAYGILLLPNDLKPGDKRPVVVCQHGLEARAQNVVTGNSPSYHDFAARLAEQGFITFAPQNPYIFTDRFRTLQRKANPLGKTLFSLITPQHQQIINFLKTLPNVDPDRIAFYGLSYGGKTAMRVPALLTDYCLSICSGDFNEWVWKNASSRSPYSYVWTYEYEIFEFDLGSTFNYAEMGALIAPRPFMVERGHGDGVSSDEAVAYEFAKVRNLYEAKLHLPPTDCQIEFFNGPHTINGKGTFEFLHRQLGFTAAQAAVPEKPAIAPINDAARDARGLDSALSNLRAPTRDTKPLPAAEALKHFKLPAGLKIDLIASEPEIRQPLHITFDPRGRMWVTQYMQYPFPAGLKVIEYDQYIRAKFDKTPLPPPMGTPGRDRITILEDTRHDGSFAGRKTFVDHLNIATSSLPDTYGVWVLNPPYLLFYPDKNHDDVPDGDPVVHLSGFGLEDTHAVANSLTWGPDGWIYGCQGSTCTAKVKVEIEKQTTTTDFLGQAIWRYHPTKHIFEIFAEGGGNTFGVEFDDKGRAYSGTNWGKYRGLHYVQGGYYIKSWGKHGPLTNPYAFGFFDHMPHTGDATRLVHTFVVYGGGLLPDTYTGKILGPNPLQSKVQVTRMENEGSTFRTAEEPNLLTTDDGWFRPVDLKAGPDGALYIADFYENRISHVDPRDTWDRTTGRLYRIHPSDKQAPIPDLTKLSTPELLKLLDSNNRWLRATARRVLALRPIQEFLPTLHANLAQNKDPQLALESLWTIHLLGPLGKLVTADTLFHPDPYVRLWTIRLLGDESASLPKSILDRLWVMARDESNPEVRSQLASTLKRLPGEDSLPLLAQMLSHNGDDKDPHIPLLLWWALEAKTISNRDQVIKIFSNPEVQAAPISRQILLPRLARRYASDLSQADQKALIALLDADPMGRPALFSGIAEAFQGRAIDSDTLLPALKAWLAKSDNFEIALRAGDKAAHDKALSLLAATDAKSRAERLRLLEILGQVGRPSAIPVLLKIAEGPGDESIRRGAISALGHFDDPAIGTSLVSAYPELPKTLRNSALSVLSSRAASSLTLLRAVEAGTIAKEEISSEQLDRLRRHEDAAVAALATRLLGPPVRPTSAEKEEEIARVKRILAGASGNAKAGEALFTTRCAVCHTLFGKGAKVGPDLTSYDRKNLDFLLLSVVDPSAYVREEFTAFRIDTKDGQTLVGLITDRSPNQITLTDATQQKTVISKDRIKREKGLRESLMPEGLLSNTGDAELRDLFAYLTSPRSP